MTKRFNRRLAFLGIERLEDRQMLAVDLGTVESFAVLAGQTVTNTGPSTIVGDLGVSPGSAVVGFPPGMVTGGVIHAADAVALQAQSDLTIAYNDLAGRASDVNLTGQDLGGLTLTPGVYTFSSSAQLTGALTLDAQGNADAEFIFQIGSTLTTASNASVLMINAADPCDVYWQVGSSATLGTDTDFAGSILALTSISLTTGADIIGRALARNGSVTLDTNHIELDDCDTTLGSIAWEKRATDTNPVLLPGATFEISPNPLTGMGTLTVVDGGANDADGLANGVLQVNNVLLGTYTITETVAPPGFANDDVPSRTVTVSIDDLNAVIGTQGSDQPGDTDESDFHDRLGSIAWEKRATDANPVLLAGATFEISPNPLTGMGTLIVVDGGANDADGLANGVLQVNDVLLGTYTITETVAPPGFALDNDPTRSVTVSVNDLNAVIGTQGVDNAGDTEESDFHNRRRRVIVIGPGKSPIAPQFVTVLDEESGAVLSQFLPYGNTFQGGVRVAAGDLTGDGIDEVVAASGRSIVGQVGVYTQSGVLLRSFLPYGATFSGGVEVAVGDVDGDGLNDIITVPSFGPAEVKVFRNVLVGGVPTFDVSNPYRSFLAFPSSFIGGAVVAVADMGSTPLTNGPFDNTQRDGKAEIVVGSGAGMTTTVNVFDVSRMITPTPSATALAAGSFTPFSTATSSYQGGVSLSVARINADLIPDILVGAGVNGGSLVDVWAWNNTTAATLSSLSANGVGFPAFTDASRTAPVQVAALDINGDDIADEILVAQGPGGTTGQIRAFHITSVSPLQVSPPAAVPGSFQGPFFIATLENPTPIQPLVAAPTSNVTAVLVNGNLVVTGDNLANTVEVFGTRNGEFRVTGSGPASAQPTTINGLFQPVVIGGVVGSILIDLHGGDDQLTMDNILLGGGLDIATGDGNDSIVLGVNGVVSTTTDLTINTGAGNDRLTELGYRVFLVGSQRVNMGDGDDIVQITGASNLRDMIVAGGAGKDEFTINGVTVVGQGYFDGGADDDNILVIHSSLVKDSSILGGTGNDILSLRGSIAASFIQINGEAGADDVWLSGSLLFSDVSLIGGSESDTLNVYAARFYKQLLIDGGGGSDSAKVDASMIDLLFATMGDGDDTLTLTSNLLNAGISLDGGLGADALIDPSRLARRGSLVRFEQFS